MERLEPIGKPNLSISRMAIAISFVLISLPFILQKGFRINYKNAIITLLLYTFVGYILFAAIVYHEKIEEITFYIFYIHLVFFGYLLIYPDNLVRFEKLINILCIIAVTVGLVITIAGPETLMAVGIGQIEGKWGQFVTTDEQTTTAFDVSRLFRSFSIFMDHQAFSVFLQLCAFFYRFMYELKRQKKYIFIVILLLVSNTMSFSTTSLLVLLIVLLSFVRLRYFLLLTPIVILIGFYLYAIIPTLVLLIFHIGSFQLRIEFAQNAFQLIQLLPSLHEMERVTFTADSYLLWMTYKYGYIYAFLQISLLIGFIVLYVNFNKGRQLPAILLALVFFINILSNGVCFSTPNNILLPILFGITAHFSNDTFQKRFSYD